MGLTRRISGTGFGARVLSFSVLIALQLAFVIAEDVPWRNPLVLVVTLALLAVVLRSLTMGVQVGADSVTVRSWLVTYKWHRNDVASVRNVAYSGLLNWGGMDGSGSFLRTLAFTIHTPRGLRIRNVRGSIGFNSQIDRQRDRIEDQLSKPGPLSRT